MLGTIVWSRGVGTVAAPPVEGGGQGGPRQEGHQTGGELLGDSLRRLGCVQAFLVGMRVHMRFRAQVLQRPFGTRDRGWTLLSWPEDADRSKASWEELGMEVKGGAIREGHRRSGVRGEV